MNTDVSPFSISSAFGKSKKTAARLAIEGGEPVRQNPVPLNLPFFDEEDFANVRRALESTMVSGDGPDCRAFEKALAAYLGVKHVFFTTSCTAALDLAFMIKDFPAGSEAIVPNFTFTSTALAPILNGLKLVLVDVYGDNGNIDVSQIEAKITSKTVAIVPVDYAGNPAEMDAINDIARRHGLYVVHDTAQSIGAEYKGRKTGTLGTVSCFSFHGTKNLVVGEGGALVTDDDDLVGRIMFSRDKGTDKHTYLSDPQKKGYYEYVCRGNSYVQSNILGALGISQLKKIDLMNGRRARIADLYLEEFRKYDCLELPRITDGAKTNWHLFYLLVEPTQKEWFINALRAEGVMANIHYSPLHINRYYRELCRCKEDDFPNSMKLFRSLVRIPIHQGMSDGDAEDVVKAVKKVADRMTTSAVACTPTRTSVFAR
jgi:dTDP-4-amino-4,6-dideoxygalactose transaminase